MDSIARGAGVVVAGALGTVGTDLGTLYAIGKSEAAMHLISEYMNRGSTVTGFAEQAAAAFIGSSVISLGMAAVGATGTAAIAYVAMKRFTHK